MKLITIFVITLAATTTSSMVMAARAASAPSASGAQQQPPPDQLPRAPKINWGRCPQLEPTQRDIEAKSSILQECLRQNPPPQSESITQEQIIQRKFLLLLKTINRIN